MKFKTASLVIVGAIIVMAFIFTSDSNKTLLKPSPNLAQVVDTIPPVTVVTSPVDGQIISGNFSTCATATDNVGVASITLRMGGIPASGTTSPLCAGWNTVNFSNGFYAVFSTATDAAGNTGTSPSILAGVANNLTTPIVKATLPVPSSVVSGTTTLSAKAYAPAGMGRVDFLIDGTSTVVATATTPSSLNTYTASWNSTTVSNGLHNIIAKAYDINGGMSAPSGTTFTVTNTGADVTPPVISAITSGSITATSAVLSWTTNEASDTQVSYGTTSAYGFMTTLDAALTINHSVTLSGLSSSTTYHFMVMSRDTAGNLATSTDQTFTTLAVIDTTPPTVALTAPIAGATVSGTTTISATAADNVGVDHVDFYAGTNLIGADATAPHTLNWDTTTVVNGNYSLTARAYDVMGNNTVSTAVAVTVNNVVIPPPDTTLPTVSLTAPTNGTSVSGIITMSAIAADNVGVTRVEFYRGTTLISTDTTGTPNYSITWDTTVVARGTYSLKAKAYDAAGNSKTSTSASVTVVDITPPVVAITNPTGSTIPSSGTVTVKTTATDISSIKYIKIYIDGVLKKQCNTTGTCNYNWSVTNVPAGAHIILVEAQDKAPVPNTTTITKTVTK